MLGKIEILAVILILVLLFYFVISFGAGAFSKKETNSRTKKYLKSVNIFTVSNCSCGRHISSIFCNKIFKKLMLCTMQ